MELQKLASHYCQAWENRYFAGKIFKQLNLEAKIIDLEIRVELSVVETIDLTIDLTLQSSMSVYLVKNEHL